MPIPLILALIIILAGGGTAVASQGSLPGDALFPMKIATERVRSAFAIGSDSEAELQARFAERRLEEIDDLLTEDNSRQDDLALAFARLEDNSARAAGIVIGARERGQGSDDLALRINDSLGFIEQGLVNRLRAEEDALRAQEDGLKDQISAAAARGDNASANQLRLQLNDVHTRRVFIEAQREGTDGFLDDREFELRRGLDDLFDDNSVAENRLDAQEAIFNADRERQDLLSDGVRFGVAVSGDRLAAVDDLLNRARSAFNGGSFREAKLLAKQSRDLSRDLQDGIVSAGNSGNSGPGSSGDDNNDDDNSGPGNSNDDNNRSGSSNSGSESSSDDNSRGGGEQELRGREQEGEVEQRGQEQEQRGQEQEVRGREQEGEVEQRGGDDSSDSGDDRGGSSSSNSNDDNGGDSSGSGNSGGGNSGRN